MLCLVRSYTPFHRPIEPSVHTDKSLRTRRSPLPRAARRFVPHCSGSMAPRRRATPPSSLLSSSATPASCPSSPPSPSHSAQVGLPWPTPPWRDASIRLPRSPPPRQVPPSALVAASTASVHRAARCTKNAMFHRYVASVSYGYCKSRSVHCIYCNGLCTYDASAYS
jgi:hypothetical protein